MSNINEVSRINNMTFGELRNELANCNNNPVRQKLIRNLMVIRYNQHLEKKQHYNKLKAQKELKKNPLLKSNFTNQSGDEISFDENDFKNLKPNHGSLNELESNDELFDSRNITEYDRDHANNNLMERLNTDMNLIKNKKQSTKDFMTPYSNNSCGMYAPFDNYLKSNKKTFSNLSKKSK